MNNPSSQDFLNCGILTGLLRKMFAGAVIDGYRMDELTLSLWNVSHFAGHAKVALATETIHNEVANIPLPSDLTEYRKGLKEAWEAINVLGGRAENDADREYLTALDVVTAAIERLQEAAQ